MEQPKILVAIRKRPLSKKEASKGETDIISVKNGDTVIVSEYKYLLCQVGKRLTLPNTSRKLSLTSILPFPKKPTTKKYPHLHSDL
jgi:hypothetical protein